MRRAARLPEFVYGLFSLVLIAAALGAGAGLLVLAGRLYHGYTLGQTRAEESGNIAALTKKIAEDKGAALYFDHVWRGYYYMHGEDYPAAAADFQGALDLAASAADARYVLLQLAAAQSALKKNEEALGSFTLAVAKASSDDATPYARRGALYDKLGRIEESRKDFDIAIALAPEDYGLRVARIEIALEGHGVRQAAREAGEVLSMLWTDAKVQRLREARADAALRWDFRKAIEANTALIALRPANADDYLQRSEYYLWIGESRKAFADIAAARKLNPYSTHAQWYLGTAYEFLLDPAKALPELDAVLVRDGEDDALNRSRGLMRFKLRRYKDAASDFARAFSLKPDAYSAIWLHLAQLYEGQADFKGLGRNLAALKASQAADDDEDAPAPPPWPEPVLRYFLGELSEDALLAKAGESNKPETARDQLCEARFYAGMLARAAHREAHGLSLLREALSNCHPGFVEAIGARWELRALQRAAK